MSGLGRAVIAAAFASTMSITGAMSAANAAPPGEDRITQEKCEAQAGAYSFDKGIRTCVTTTTSVADDWNIRGAVSLYESGTRTYYNPKFRITTETTTVTTKSQRGNQTPTVATENSVNESYAMYSCRRIDNNGTSDETTTFLDLSECEQRVLYWAGTWDQVE